MHSKLLAELERRLADQETVAVVTVVEGPAPGQALLASDGSLLAGGFPSEELARAVISASRPQLAQLHSARKEVTVGEEVWDVFFEVHPPPPQIIVVGAVHVAIHLTAFGKRLGYRTVVVDPRTAFATKERFTEADELLIDWPAEALAETPITENTYFAMLAHDLKIDLPALEIALASPARYVGALGSKRTHAKRTEALTEKGFTADDIARIHNPIGLDLGGRRAEDIALSIVAEMQAVRHGRDG